MGTRRTEPAIATPHPPPITPHPTYNAPHTAAPGPVSIGHAHCSARCDVGTGTREPVRQRRRQEDCPRKDDGLAAAAANTEHLAGARAPAQHRARPCPGRAGAHNVRPRDRKACAPASPPRGGPGECGAPRPALPTGATREPIRLSSGKERIAQSPKPTHSIPPPPCCLQSSRGL